METLTEVCNSALHLIGEEPIVNYDDEVLSNTHRVLKAHLTTVIREVEVLAEWPELVSSGTVVSTGTWVDGLGMQFTLPEKSLRLLRVGDSQRNYVYEETGGKLWVRAPDVPADLPVVYLRYSETPSEWAPLLTTSITKLLAARITGGIAHDLAAASGMEQQFWKEYFPTVAQQIRDRLFVRGSSNTDTLGVLCEAALRALGAPQVSDWQSEASIPAAALRANIYAVLKEVQSLTKWPELITRAKLQWTGGSDAKDGLCFYKPDGCLRIIDCGSNWLEEGGYVFVRGISSSEQPWCRYVKYSENPSEWSGELFGLTTKLLAARIAASGVGDPKTGRALEQEFWAIHRPRVVTQVLNRSRKRGDYRSTQSY